MRLLSVQFVFILCVGAIGAQSCSTSRLAPGHEGKYSQTGKASWYGKQFQGRRTASGEPFDMNQFTCAHPHFKFGTKVRITNLANGKSVVAVVNDRGPYADGRIVDVSYGAAKELGFVGAGVADVKLEIVSE